jgi:MSHA biogenesis protein MshI
VDLKFLHKENALPGLCCLYFLPDKLIVTHVLRSDQKPTITFIEASNYEPNMLRSILENIIKKHGLEGVACSWVLHSSYYQLFLLDAPAVSEAEIPLALRWQIKELIDFSPDDAVIQYFLIPSTMPGKKKIYVAVAKKAQLQPVVDMISEVGFDLKYIDITELALRNINAVEGDDQCYLGFLAFHREHVEFIITSEKNFLLSRRLSLPNAADLNTLSSEWLTNLIAEIQHSFVYCKSQQRQEFPEKLVVLTTVPKLVAQLNELLNIATEQLNIEKKINVEFVTSSADFWSLDHLIAVGGALRSE